MLLRLTVAAISFVTLEACNLPRYQPATHPPRNGPAA